MVNPEQVNSIKQGIEHYLDFKNNPYAQALGQLSGGGNQYRSPMEATRGSNPFDIARQNIQNKAQDSRSSSDLTPFDPILLQPFQHQDRYQADNFNPRDYEGNVSRYTAADTWGKTFEKSFSDFGHKFKTSFTEGYETTGRILRSIFTLGHYGILPDEDEMMRKYFEDQKNELRNAIFLTPEAEDRFFNKKLLKDFIGNSGFAFGTIFEMGMEALLTWGVGAAISGGIKGASSLAQLGVKGATREAIKEIGEKTALKALPQSTADNAAMVVFSNSDEAVKGATRAANIKNSAETARRSVRESFNTMNNFFSDPNVAKNIYSKLGAGFEKYTPVLGNAITTVKDFNKARKLGASADKLFDIGYNGLRRSFVEFSAAASEATIESISAYGDMFTSLQQEFVDKNGRIPTPAEMEKMHSTAIKTASDVNALNMGVLLAMNKIQFGDLMQKWMPTSKYMKGFLNDEASSVAKTRLVKDGVKQKIYREGALGVLGSTKKIAQDFGKKKAAWEVAKAFGKSTLRFEGSEGVQELIQEGGSHAIAEYNKSVYNSNPMSLADAFGEGVSSQWNEQGFKTFLIGAFTGRLVGAGKAVIDPLVEAASRLPKDKQEQYKEYIKQVDSDISTLNSFFENPSNSVLENVQSLKESMSASERLNKYAAGENAYRFNNAKDDAFVAAVKSARRLQATDALYDAIDSFGDNFTPEEFKEAFGIDINETEFTSVKDYASDIRNQVKSYVDTYDKLQQELGAKINPMFYADGSVEQKRARLIQHSLNQMIDVLAINSIKEGQSVKRLQNLSRELASDPEIGGSSEYVLRTLSDLSVLTSELGAISKEINDLKTLGDYESLLKAKELEELASAMKAFSPFFDPKDGTFIGTLSDETLKKDEISEEEIDSGMYNENVSALIEKIINGQNKRYNGKDISKKGLDKNFRKIVDYIRLNQDAKSFSKAIDAFYDPKTFEKLQHSFFDGTFKAVASSYLNQMQSPYSILKYAQKISEEQGLDLTEAIVEAAERIKNNPNVKELHAIYMSDTQSYELMEYIDTLLENFNNDITSKEEEADKKDPEKEAEVNAEEVAKDEEKKPLSNMEIETAPEEEKKTVLEQELSDEVDKTAFLKMMSDLDEAAEREGWSNIMDENNVYSDPSHPFNKFYNTLVGLYASEKVVYEVAVMNPNNSSEDLEAIRDDIFDKLDDEVIRRVKALYKELSAGNLRGPDSIYIPVAKTKPSTTFSDLIRDAKTPDEMWSILEKMDESGSNTPDLYEEWSKAFNQKFPENYTEPVEQPVEQPVQESVAESVFTEEQLDAVKGYISQILNVPKNSLKIIEVLNSERAVQVFKDPANQNKSLKEVIDILLSKEAPVNTVSENTELIEKRKKLSGWDASYELAKIAKLEGVDLSKLSREEYAEYAIKNYLKIDDSQLRANPKHRNATTVQEVVDIIRSDRSSLTQSVKDAFDSFYRDMMALSEKTQNERFISEGVRILSGTKNSNSWLFFSIGNGTNDNESTTHKSYFSLKDLNNFSPEVFKDFMAELQKRGYNGGVKIFQDLEVQGPALSDQVVMHGYSEADAKLALEVAKEFYGDRLLESSYGKDEVINGESKSYSQILSDKIQREVDSKAPVDSVSTIELIEKRKEEELSNIGRKALEKRLQNLREATSEEQIAQAIFDINKNIKNGARIRKEEQDFVDQKLQELNAKGFDIVDLTDKIFDSGLNLTINNIRLLEADENLTEEQINSLEKELENRKRRIKKLKERGLSEEEANKYFEDTISIMITVRPQLNKDGKMVQGAIVNTLKFEVSDAEKILERSKKNPSNKAKERIDKINAKYKALEQQKTDETAKQEEPMLEGVQATRDETKVGQESTELRTEEATQEEIESKEQSPTKESDMDMTISDIQEKLNVPLENLPKAIAQRILYKDKNLRSAYMVLQEYLKLNDPLVDFNSWFNQNYMLSSDSDYAKNLLRDLETDMYERAYEYEELSNYSEQNVPGLTMVESFIHAYNVKVRAEDFDQYGDRNIRIDGGPEFNLKYIRSDARPLDAIAQELSSMFRFESQLEGQARGYGEDVITPQDIIDYIIERESDPDRFNGKTEKQLEKRRKEIERSVNAKEAYSIAMSLPILESSIDKLYRMRKLTTEQKDIIAEYIEYKLKNKGKRILPMPVENQEDTYLAKALSEDQGLDSIFTDNSPWKTDPLEKESSYLDEPSEAEPGEQLSFFSEGDTVLNNKGQKVAKTKSESDSKQLALNLNDGVSLEQAAQLYLKDSYDLQNALTFSKMMHIAFDKSNYETMSEFLLSKDGKKALKNVAKKILSANVIEQVFDSGVIQQETTTPSIESVATIQEKFSRSTLEAFVYSQEALKQTHLNLENTQESSNLSLEDSISKDLTEIFTCFLK